MRLRGEICIGFASILSFTSMIILIFVHVGQINTSTIPRKIYMVRVNMGDYLATLQDAVTDANPVLGLYANNASAPLQDQTGLRQFYEFGLYSYCAYVDEKTGSCGNHTVGHRYTPYDIITADMISNYSSLTNIIVPGNTFRDARYLGNNSRSAYWMLLLGTICAALTVITGITVNSWTFFLSSSFAGVGSLFLLVGASLWTVLIKKSEIINVAVNPLNLKPIRIFVTQGNGLSLTWAAFVCLFVSLVPYIVSCCTYRG